MEQQYILTPAEADILSTINNDDGASIYEITTATRLTPSEALEQLIRLRDRGLLELKEDNRLARFTDEGRYVRTQLERQGHKPFASAAGSTPVVILSEDTAMGASGFEEWEVEDLDSALESEFQRLDEEATAGQT